MDFIWNYQSLFVFTSTFLRWNNLLTQIDIHIYLLLSILWNIFIYFVVHFIFCYLIQYAIVYYPFIFFNWDSKYQTKCKKTTIVKLFSTNLCSSWIRYKVASSGLVAPSGIVILNFCYSFRKICNLLAIKQIVKHFSIGVCCRKRNKPFLFGKKFWISKWSVYFIR